MTRVVKRSPEGMNRHERNSGRLSFSQTSSPRGPDPAQTESGTERVVDGQAYVLLRVRGQLR